jgi:hypothetical protein
VTREPDPTGFDAIVASWRAEGNVPEWPDDLRLDDDATDVDPDDPPTEAGTEADADDRTDPRPDAPGPGPAGVEGPPLGRHTDRLAADHPGTDTPGSSPHGDRPDAAPDPAAPGVEHRDPDHGGAAPRRGTDPAAEDRRDPTSRERGHLARPAVDPLADEHFVPPEPPPLPRMGPPILIGLTLITLGLVLVTFPGWVGVPQVYGLPLGLVAIAAGLGWLVLRLWPDPDDVPPPLYLDDPDDPDGGAVL